MGAADLPEAALREQLDEWLDLRLNKHVPATIMMLSRVVSGGPRKLLLSRWSRLRRKLLEISRRRVSNSAAAMFGTSSSMALVRWHASASSTLMCMW